MNSSDRIAFSPVGKRARAFINYQRNERALSRGEHSSAPKRVSIGARSGFINRHDDHDDTKLFCLSNKNALSTAASDTSFICSVSCVSAHSFHPRRASFLFFLPFPVCRCLPNDFRRSPASVTRLTKHQGSRGKGGRGQHDRGTRAVADTSTRSPTLLRSSTNY